jgi:hypothetical protein
MQVYRNIIEKSRISSEISLNFLQHEFHGAPDTRHRVAQAPLLTSISPENSDKNTPPARMSRSI